MRIDRRTNGMFFSQDIYINKIVEPSRLMYYKSTYTPLPSSHRLCWDRVPRTYAESREMANVPFRYVLGAIIYSSTRTRPDIYTAVSMLENVQSDLISEDWKVLTHLLRYLKGIIKYVLLIPTQCNPFRLIA